MPTTEPVVIPVDVDVSRAQTALQQLGGQVATMRSAGTGPAAPAVAAGGGPPGPTAAGTLDPFATMRSFMREMVQLEQATHRLSLYFDALSRGQGTGGVAAPAVPQPAVRVPGGGRRPEEEEPHPVAREVGEKIGDSVRETIMGTLALAGIGIGLGAAFREVSSWISETHELGQGIAGTAIMGNVQFGRTIPALYENIYENVRGTPRTTLGKLLTPEQRLRGTHEGFIAGMDNPQAAETVGGLGIMAFGQPGPGMGIATSAYATYRSQQIPDMMATLVQFAKADNVSLAELLKQFIGVRGVMEGHQGQFARTPAQLTELVNMQGMLSALPGAVGAGEGGVKLAEQIAAFPQGGGLNEAIALRAYSKTGKSAFGTAHDRLEYLKWKQSPEGMVAVQRTLKEEFGADVGTLLMTRYGQQPIKPVEEWMKSPMDMHRVPGLADAEKVTSPELGEPGEKMPYGIDVLRIAADAQRKRTDDENWMVEIEHYLSDLVANHPIEYAAVAGLLGALGIPILGVILKRVSLRAAAALAATGTAGAAGAKAAASAAAAAQAASAAQVALAARGAGAAGGVGALTKIRTMFGMLGLGGAARLAWKGVPYLAPAVGAGELTKDILDQLGVTGEPGEENELDMIAGILGAILGMLMGAPAGPGGAIAGGLGGYGVGKSARQFFGGTPAGAATGPPGGGGSGSYYGGGVPGQGQGGRPQGRGGAGVPAVGHEYVDKLVAMGWRRNEAVAAVANMVAESGLDPGARNKDSGAIGLMQWLGARKRGLIRYAQATHRSVWDPNVQLEWTKMERSGESAVKPWLGGAEYNNYWDAFGDDKPGQFGVEEMTSRFAGLVERASPEELNKSMRRRINAARKLAHGPGGGGAPVDGPEDIPDLLRLPRVAGGGFPMDGGGQEAAELHVYIHLDPASGAKVTSSGTRGVKVQRAS